MGNCAACMFFCCVEPIAKSGKGSAHVKTYSVRQTTNHIKRAVKTAEKNNENMAWVEFASDCFPEDVVNQSIKNIEKSKGIKCTHISRSERSVRIEFSIK